MAIDMKFQQYLTEGIRVQDYEKAVANITSYLQRHIGKLYRYNEIEQFTGTNGSGFGLRYFTDDGRSIRFNWSKSNFAAALESISIWTGKTNHPNFTITAQDGAPLGSLSLALALPAIVKAIKNPTTGNIALGESVALNQPDNLSNLVEQLLLEDAFDDVIGAISSGRVSRYTVAKMGRAQERIFSDIITKHPDWFDVNTDAAGRQRFTFTGTLSDITREAFGQSGGRQRASNGYIQVSSAGNETTTTEGERNAERTFQNAPERIPFEEQIEDMQTIVGAVVKGASNFAVILGAGGLGKTFQVEKTLHGMGLQDGEGYFKNTASGSPSGLFKTLFINRTGIVVLDDCDTLLNTQEGRNLLKAALDTKKRRKLVWGKSAHWLFDPSDEYEVTAAQEAIDQGLEPEKYPRYYDYEGRVILISNLTGEQLDPDGALSTRGFVLVLDPTREEVFAFMEKILPEIEVEGELSSESRQAVMELIRKQTGDVNIRKLVRGLNMAASGVPNWQRIVERYC